MPEMLPAVEPIPSATVVLLRDGDDGIETFLTQRAARLSFSGFWVFPGGQVDPGDAKDFQGGDEEIAIARRAAVRETFEEVGIVLREDALVPLSWWVTPDGAARRYATWMFLAELDDPADKFVVDANEISAHAWMTPADVLRGQRAGEINLAPPTWVTLWHLHRARTTAQALSYAAERVPERLYGRPVTTETGIVLLEPGDAGYETWDVTVPGPRHRLILNPHWEYERTID